jgi:D-proline reductase (dithiol) PrdB
VLVKHQQVKMNDLKTVMQANDQRVIESKVERKNKFDFKEKKDRLIAKLFTKYPSLFKKWVHRSKFIEFSDSPWTPFDKDITKCRLALVTTGGVHLKLQKPFDMKDPAGDPTFREIPADARPADLTITHNYYDHADADRDINVVFSIERVQELKQSNEIGDVNYRHFSFMGHIMHHHIKTLMKETAPSVAAALKSDKVDIVILTPA